MRRRTIALSTALLAGALALSGCASGDPLADSGGETPTSGEPLVIGSQDYYSNEIIAEIYAQALEAQGVEVEREFRIGQREVYLPELEAGKIDLFPEYTGNLLQYWEPDTEARLSDDVYTALDAATPDGLRVLAQSPATDQDAYTVTADFAKQWQLTDIDDLAKVDTKLTLGGNSEAETRPYGPAGLAQTYGIEGVGFTPIEDGGGPLTVKALQDNSIQLAIIYTADPSAAENDLVALNDTKGIFLASHVVPLASDRVDDAAAKIIDSVSAAMTPADLLELNARSVGEELPAAQIAGDWLAEQDLA
ncbi:ABC transporter substrate-binding protein [Leucobacter luti]|uniref:Osmoprotectant transport system substrate-binding protein n=1 Tax=Leucobacter luti TaxID=340320 RepID=A0A4R6S7C1_9MICO|nr:ABC transporter substrate-binding protein [Leucobacter luti]MCW2288631.1 osmoprotectant transport system substrate-binding protein [Leucobacter luti]QYM75443.1 ABC transporter substrate-binding protein [Leucobacter luti]TCK45212.1 osmoprotectant transport system substrate-binding protein [Leucobacter luti]TDP95742.1 osmoprotectant transport system substrate-binding protein [Leucobacter luti]